MAPDIVVGQVDTPGLVEIARGLFREYAEAIGTDLEYQGFSEELAALPSPYIPPRGALLIARAETEVAGCVAMRPLTEEVAEMKRLYVRSSFRSFGLGRRLVEAVVNIASGAGYKELRLDTLASMGAAHALYLRLGFVEIPPYNTAHLPGTRFFSLKVAA
jgi:GNAT superfamily N-acetyltransferase